jgi:hypothetical protein
MEPPVQLEATCLKRGCHRSVVLTAELAGNAEKFKKIIHHRVHQSSLKLRPARQGFTGGNNIRVNASGIRFLFFSVSLCDATCKMVALW